MSLPARLQDPTLTARPRRVVAAIAMACAVLGAGSWIALLAQRARGAGPSLSTLVVEWPGRSPAAETGAGVLDAPVLPGAIAQVFALAAAAESGLVSSSTTYLCRRVVTADGRRFVCTHPDLKRPLTPAEALAYSCTDFFADLATRLPRASLNRLRRGVGLVAVGDDAPWTSAVIGLAGPPTSPRQLLTAVARVAGVGPDTAVPLRASTRALVRSGLRGVADFGPGLALVGRERPSLMTGGASPLPG
ncbi:MAG: hypothetical protein ABI880_05315, partial [Acidobacteriota bacterium]